MFALSSKLSYSVPISAPKYGVSSIQSGALIVLNEPLLGGVPGKGSAVILPGTALIAKSVEVYFNSADNLKPQGWKIDKKVAIHLETVSKDEAGAQVVEGKIKCSLSRTRQNDDKIDCDKSIWVIEEKPVNVFTGLDLIRLPR